MESLTHQQVVYVLLQLSIMLFLGRIMAELARRLKQPPVAGELLAGIILGPTILGTISPEIFDSLFPHTGAIALTLDGFVQVAVVLLLFIAGLEVELQIVIDQGKQALYTSFLGLVVPFLTGFGIAFAFPDFFNVQNDDQKLLFALFLGTSMSITALPVIARILMDLNIFKSRIGMLVISSSMVNDLAGWLIFSVIISLMGKEDGAMSLFSTISLTLGFTLVMLTIGKALINSVLPWVNKHLAWPGGLLSLSLSVCFLGAAFTEYIGIHAVFGAFIVGVALGDSEHLSEKAKEIIHQFINNIFSPLFFVSIGLKVNFAVNFNLSVVIVVLVIAIVGKVLGSGLGSYLGGFSKNESLAVGFGMNARGAMEIILGLVALEVKLIDETIFVALVVMALVTSMMSGPLMKYFLKKEKDTIQPEITAPLFVEEHEDL